ncbi:MAG TPA: alkaline phosphatase family protein [Dictyobacter sp.]|nr:alkaline phosphatase family protein [Dictyobacter sp.]
MGRARVFLLGVDGLTFHILRPMMERGLLPHFQRLYTDGVHGTLQSTVPPMTPPAWMSIATGLAPAKHGVYDFWDYKRADQGLQAYVITQRKGGQAIWNILSEWGKRVIVANVPMTYPPEPVNGIMVSGYMAPDMTAHVTYPLDFKRELLRKVPEYRIDLTPAVAGEQVGNVLAATLDITRSRIQLLQLLLEKTWDFCFLTFVGADRIQHVYWDAITSMQPLAVQYYQMLDEALGMIISALQKEDLLMLVSDHGFQGAKKNFYLQEYLCRLGLTQMRSQSVRYKAKLRGDAVALLWSLGLRGFPSWLRQRLYRSGILPTAQQLHAVCLPDLNWATTSVFIPSPSGSIAGYADIFISDDLTEQDIAQLQQTLNAIRDPSTGEPFAVALYREDAFGTGPYAPPERHLILISGADMTPLTELGGHSLWSTRKKRIGIHHPDGVLCLYGAQIKHGVEIAPAHVYDIVPTILSFMGVPLPETLDGRAITDVFVQDRHTRSPTHGIVQQKLRQIRVKKL